MLPIQHKDRFEKLGIRPPKGVLLYGAPGTGKTLLARACAAQTNATFLKLAGPQLVQMFIGDGAKMVRVGWAWDAGEVAVRSSGSSGSAVAGKICCCRMAWEAVHHAAARHVACAGMPWFWQQQQRQCSCVKLARLMDTLTPKAMHSLWLSSSCTHVNGCEGCLFRELWPCGHSTLLLPAGGAC